MASFSEQRRQGVATGPGGGTQSAGKWVLAATIGGSAMAFLDGTVVNVALPVLQKDLHATVVDAQWVVEAYTLFLAALILVGGSLGDIYGRKRIFTIGIGVFTLASVWCGLAPTAGQLILARAVQGVGGALLTPGSLAIISAYFPPAERGRAIGTWSGAASIVTALGPALGGFLVQQVSWRLVFFINIPLAAIVLTILFTKVPESRDEEVGQRLDYPGAALATVGLGALVYGLVESSNRGIGDALVLGALAVGVAALVLFVVVEARSRHPMMPLRLFRSRTFSGANALTLFLYAALSAATFFVPFNLIQVQGYSPTAAGASFLPFSILMATLSRWAGGLIPRYGAKLPLVVGPLITGLGFVLLGMPGIGGSYWTTFFPGIVVMGLGMSIAVAPLTTAVMGAVGVSHAGIASGINNAVARTGSLMAIAVMGLVVVTAFSASLDNRMSALNLPPQAQQQVRLQKAKLASIELPADLPPPTAAALKQNIDLAFLDGFRLVVYLSAGLAAASALCALLFVEGKPRPAAKEARAAPVLEGRKSA